MNTDILRECIDAPVLKRSLVVAIVVGTILNVINQGDTILSGEAPIIWKTVLTYMVPFCVATYGAYSACAATQKASGNDH